MIECLPELYRLAAIEPVTVPSLESRSKSINSILTKRKFDWLLNCVKLYLKRPIQNEGFLQEFTKAFVDDDPLFHDGRNGLELQVLASAIILEYLKIKKDKGNDRILIALAVACGRFTIDASSIVNFKVVEAANAFLAKEAGVRRSARELPAFELPELPVISDNYTDVPSLAKSLHEFSKEVHSIFSEMEKNENAMRRKIFVLEEESDFHWWLFRGYSSVLELKLSDVGPNIAPFAIALEMFMLTKMLPMPVNYMELFKKAFSEVDGLSEINMSIESTVNAIYAELPGLKAKVTADAVAKFGNTVPLLFALTTVESTGGDAAWKVLFKRGTGIDASEELPAIGLASQLYRELLLVFGPNF